MLRIYTYGNILNVRNDRFEYIRIRSNQEMMDHVERNNNARVKQNLLKYVRNYILLDGKIFLRSEEEKGKARVISEEEVENALYDYYDVEDASKFVIFYNDYSDVEKHRDKILCPESEYELVKNFRMSVNLGCYVFNLLDLNLEHNRFKDHFYCIYPEGITFCSSTHMVSREVNYVSNIPNSRVQRNKLILPDTYMSVSLYWNTLYQDWIHKDKTVHNKTEVNFEKRR